jgi:pyruvate dehydrogenase E2 component (dihydrolipoamide acetyltransferase)
MEVESTVAGTLRQIVVEPGRTVPIGTVLAYVEPLVGDAPGPALEVAGPLAATTTPRTEPGVSEPKVSPEVLPARAAKPGAGASPRARKLARELDVDISGLDGTGPGGLIVEEDVRKRAAAAQPQGTSSVAGYRQLIAERLTRSIQTIPHFTLSLELNAERLLELYESLKMSVEKATGLKLTVTDLLLKALGLSLREIPEMNRVWEGGQCKSKNTVVVGLAVHTERGVVSPVIGNLDSIALAEIVPQRISLAEKARAGRLSLAELQGGVGTLSNLGMYRVDHFQAIISPGQSFVLAVGRICNRPWVKTSLEIRPTIILNLSVDHRVADGVAAVLFLEKIAEIIEKPNWIR